MKLAASVLLFAAVASAYAQTPQFTDPANLRGERVKPRDGRELPIDTGASGLAQLLRKLSTRASILNIVAHPDDEDGGMLTFYARGLGARVTDLSLTRGEGGQNAVTGDFEDALGLLRTQELLANDRYTGVDQLFGTEVDFGFSKTKSEAFAKWTHDRVLYDAVRAIRLVRPLVITATFIGGVTDGHGQHQVSGQIAQEAFLAAADPNVFPDQIAEGILPWQALRVYARVPFADINAKGVFDYATGQYVAPHFVNYVTGKLSTTKPPIDVIVPEGTPDPLFTAAAANPSDLPLDAPIAPLSYAQFSRIGLGLQRTQISKNMRLPTSGDYDSGYTLYGSVLCADHNPIKNCLLDRNTKRTAEGLATTHVPRGFSLGSHGPSPELGFSPQGMPSPAGHGPNFFTGIDTSILAIQDLAPDAFPTDMLSDIARGITAATEQFDPAHPEKIAPALAASLKVMDELIPEVEKGRGDPIAKANALHELRIKRVQLNDALAVSLGLSFEVKAHTGAPNAANLVSVVPGSKVAWDWHIDHRDTSPVTLLGWETVDTGHFDSRFKARILGKQWDDSWFMQFDDDPVYALTAPYFHRPDIQQPFYDLSLSAFRNSPGKQSLFQPVIFLRYNDTNLTISTVPTPAIAMSPTISVSVDSKAVVLPSSEKSFSLRVHVQSGNSATTPGSLHLELPSDWKCKPENAPLKFESPGATLEVSFAITPAEIKAISASKITAVASVDGRQYREGFRAIGYPGLPTTNYYTPATTRIVPVDLTVPTRHNIAYLPGTGDAVTEALASIGLTPMILTVADLTATNLAKFDTVILGVRTYNAHPDLHGAPTAALLDFARNGGNVVVQYQTPEFTAADAPYPLSLGSNEKVVDETAPVKLLGMCDNGTPAHWCEQSNTNQTGTMPGSISDYKLLTTPNRITAADFNDWIEERGHGFLSTWDPRYTALTETHDPGVPAENIAAQLPQRGGLITAAVGKGRWTYCAFALYRQLPEAVPGAFRLFINLLNP